MLNSLKSRRLSANTITLLFGNGVSTLLAFALSVIIGRVLGEDGLGVYAAALAWIFPLTLAVDFGYNTLLTRDVAADLTLTLTYIHTAARQRLLVGIPATLGMVALAPLLTDDPALIVGLRISAPLLFIEPLFGTYTATFRAHRVMWHIATLNVGMLVVQIPLTAGAFALGYGVVGALAVNTLTSAGRLAGAWWVYRVAFKSDADLSPLVGIVRRALPFAVAGVLAAAQPRIGLVLLEQLADAGEVGIYAAAGRFVEAGRTLPYAFFGALFPALAELSRERTRLNRLFFRASLGLAAYTLFGGVFAVMFARPILQLTYGEAFAPSVFVLQLAVWSLLPSLLREVRAIYWYARGGEVFVNIAFAGGLALRVALSLWLIPAYGAVGLAAANLLAEVGALALIWHRPGRQEK